MSELFIKVYLDEDVDVLVADLLKAYGFDALTTHDAGCLRQTDEEQIGFAISHKRAFVTHNRSDFESIAESYFRSNKEHHGIIIVVRRPPHQLAQRLLKVLNHLAADEMKNQIIYI